MKVRRFLKDWMLPLAIVAGIVIYLVFHNVPALHGVAAWYYPYNNTIMPLGTFLVLFVTFCKADFKKLIPVKWHLRVAIVQIVVALLLVWVINSMHITGAPLVLLEAALVCIVCPCATAAAVMTAKLGGNLEETTSFTFISNILSALLISLFFPMLPHTTGGETLSFLATFACILRKVGFVLFFPMVVAFVVKHWMKPFHRAVVGIKDLSFYLWAGTIVVDAGTTAMNITNSMDMVSLSLLFTIAALSLLVCLMQFSFGHFIGRHIDKSVDCGQALGQKNTTVAIWVATVFLNPLSSVGPGCYILWQNTINSIEIYARARKERRQPAFNGTPAPRLARSRVVVRTKSKR
ncbi:MAG: transporter [Prevotella sp.]|nr:transporter [Prevotella sp.]